VIVRVNGGRWFWGVGSGMSAGIPFLVLLESGVGGANWSESD